MNRLIAAFALVVAGCQAPAPPNTDQFNLDCQFELRMFLVGKLEEKPNVSGPRTYTFDLTRRQWCNTRDCQPADIQDVTASEIRFQDKFGADYTINRNTGELVGVMGDTDLGSRTTGACKKAPFTPFPAAKF
ncbi:MAG: hypothetical protein EON58_13000 [Alphaproteobacteria bacterium]|nr:MAG: hypothetical protein EON58_13000 [Alphaproteobacteria bacterium]